MGNIALKLKTKTLKPCKELLHRQHHHKSSNEWSLYTGVVWIILTSYEQIHSNSWVYCFTKYPTSKSTKYAKCLRFLHLTCQLDFCSQFSSCCLQIIFSWYLTLLNYIWNLMFLILQAGDIETNPAPQKSDSNPVLCSICFKRINKGPNLEAASTCYNQYCEAWNHIHRHGITLSQNRHAKTMGREIRWFYPQHGNGKVEISRPV